MTFKGREQLCLGRTGVHAERFIHRIEEKPVSMSGPGRGAGPLVTEEAKVIHALTTASGDLGTP